MTDSVDRPGAERRVAFLGVPMDLGRGLRGVDMGPNAVRIAGIEAAIEELGLRFEDRGNVPVRQPERQADVDPRARYLEAIAECCARLRAQVEGVLADGALPLVVGGDHSIAVGTVAGIGAHHHRRGERIGLIWFDAHADMNTPDTSESGNIHGMPLAAILGFGAPELTGLGATTPMVDPRNTCLVGIRSVDAHERAIVKESGVRVFTMEDIDMHGIHQVMRQAIETATDGTAGFHLSFDVDGMDPTVARGVGTPVRGGTTFRESHLVMELVARSGRLLGLEITEVDPILDHENATAELAVDLIQSALGKRTL